MEWTQEQNLRKEEERIGEPEEQEENAREREKAEIVTIWNFFSLYTVTYFTSNRFPLKSNEWPGLKQWKIND